MGVESRDWRGQKRNSHICIHSGRREDEETTEDEKRWTKLGEKGLYALRN